MMQECEHRPGVSSEPCLECELERLRASINEANKKLSRIEDEIRPYFERDKTVSTIAIWLAQRIRSILQGIEPDKRKVKR